MPNYMLRLAFVGTNYHGWQVQPNLPTVQGKLKECLEKIFQEEVKLIGCCRTDSGVHAQEYVANFNTSRPFEETSLLRALNSLLPKDIGVHSVSPVEDTFNARYSVKGKTYLYRIWNSESRNPFLYPFSWQIPTELDMEKLGESLELIRGLHDFSGFAKLEEEKNTMIELETELRLSKPLIEIRFRASHFLRYMVRRIVGSLVKRAEGKLSRGEFEDYLRGKKSPHTAPPKGLTLEKVYL